MSGAFLDFRLKWQCQGKTGEIKAGEESLFHRAFLGLRHEMVDWSPAWEVIVEDVLEPFVADQFQEEGAAGVDVKRTSKSSGTGFDWQELAPSTVKQRGSEHPILNFNGLLRRSFTKGGAAHQETVTPKKLVWGSLVPYALFHQTGTGKGFQKERVATGPGTGRGMPMRKILSLTDTIKRRTSRTMSGRITQVARQLGFKITAPSERGGLSPAEAARIGRIALGLRS